VFAITKSMQCGVAIKNEDGSRNSFQFLVRNISD
jgi:hypothetical protein